MHKRHWNAYDGCTFVHYVLFGPLGVDRPTLELCLRNYNKNLENFQFKDAKTRKKMDCTFDLDWVHNHTGFVTDGEIIHRNRDPNNRIWKMNFANKQAAGKNGRRYVDGLLEMLVDSKSHKDVEDFVLLQILYQCSMIWCPSSVQGVPRHLFKYVGSIKRVKSVAWGRFIFSEIKEGIDIALVGLKEPGVTYVPGCMPLIPLWYYEMTGIKKYAISNSKKPPLTNWVLMGEKSGSLRTKTIISKAEKAGIVFVEKPIAKAGTLKEKYPLTKDDVSHRKRKTNTELFVRKDNAQSPTKKAGESMTDRRAKSEDKGEKDAISSIVAKIEEAISREDEIEKLPIEEQLVFWRNAAKINQRIFEVTMRETTLLYDAYGKEVHNLNKRLKVFYAKSDVIAPEDIKEKINNKIARKQGGPNLVLVNSHRSTLNNGMLGDPELQLLHHFLHLFCKYIVSICTTSYVPISTALPGEIPL
ncbi:uncharacterized protein LOC109833385 [Asparagus officinalis]|uniref:uncharacterized protein LOC109833385 n=1 Tax=Asparagus officinalis TaxID=4686 RepID=UPI00098E67AD|nr:uncharacterized protein LOC109833385 [Asparagus officinalis]